MTLLLPKRIAEGRVAALLGQAEDIARRMREGDGTVGWRGEPSLELCYDHDRKVYCAVHRDREGKPYIAASSPTCDAQLLVALARADMANDDVFARIRREQEAVERAEQAEFDERIEAANEKGRWAMRRDTGWDTRGQFAGWTKGT